MNEALGQLQPRRWLALAALCALGWLVFLKFISVHPSAAWLSTRIAMSLGFAAFFTLACLAAGSTVLRWLTKGPRRDGHWAIAFAMGAIVFADAIALLGYLHLLWPAMIWALPLTLLFFGRKALIDDLLHAWNQPRAPFSRVELFWLMVGAVGLFMVLLPTANPENVNFDARWYHLAMAERYGTMGAITKAVEGNATLAGPQLASWLYTWAFLDSSTWLFDRVMRANHLEAACFVFTLAAIPATARALWPKLAVQTSRWAWVGLFFFPSLYVYDTGLMGGADHVAALFVPVILIAWFQARQRDDRKSWVLLGVLMGGLALTKYTAIVLLVPLGLAIAAERLWLLWGQRSKALQRALVFPLVCLGTALAVSATYWLRNWIWYGDPVYPVAAQLFHAHPWVPDAPVWAQRYASEYSSLNDSTLTHRLLATLPALWNYHLALYTWEDFVANTPVFGSLYALSMGVLPFLRDLKRLWVVAVILHLGIALWFNLSPQMRYLIPFVPAMTASMAVVFAQVWGWKNWLLRAALIGAMALQLLCAADVAFLPTHRMNGKVSPVAAAVAEFGRGQENNLERFHEFGVWTQFGQHVPPKATVLLHGNWPTLGFNHPTVTDSPGIQYGLSYGQLGSVDAIRKHLLEQGVTWVGWHDDNLEPNTVSDELLFRVFTRLGTGAHSPALDWTFAPIAEQTKPLPKGELLYLGCGGSYQTGLYALGDLNVPHLAPNAAPAKLPQPKETSTLYLKLIDKAGYLVSEEGCAHPTSFDGFKPLGKNTADGLTLSFFLRNSEAK